MVKIITNEKMMTRIFSSSELDKPRDHVYSSVGKMGGLGCYHGNDVAKTTADIENGFPLKGEGRKKGSMTCDH